MYKEKILVGLSAFISFAVGGFDYLFNILALLITIDYITGLVKSVLEDKTSSKECYKGILKKSMIFVVIILGNQLDKVAATNGTFRNMCIYFYIGNEGISMLENLTIIGVPFPKQLKDILIQVNEDKNKTEGK